MGKGIRVAIVAAVAAVLTGASIAPAAAQASRPAAGFDSRKVFFGGGLSSNEISGSGNGTGFQIFGGYAFGEMAKNLHLDAEVGYMDTGTMDVQACQTVGGFGTFCVTGATKATGLWGNGVVRYVAAPNVELIGRAGLDIGDDDGFMFGVGAGFLFNRNAKLRFEVVERSHVSSLQLNFVYTP